MVDKVLISGCYGVAMALQCCLAVAIVLWVVLGCYKATARVFLVVVKALINSGYSVAMHL